jgi:glyoxylase-like metal-dependent hydrolase (beta-lactamase superfamily II)
MQNLNCGNIRISIINTGDLALSLKEMESVPEEDQARLSSLIENNASFPCNSILIEAQGKNILIDPGNYKFIRSFDASFAAMVPAGYIAPPDLETQLKSLDITPGDIDYVVITHAHPDHYSGVTSEISKGRYAPSFPKARYLLGKLDWESEFVQTPLKNENSAESRSLGLIRKAGLLDLVEREKMLTSEVKIIPSPGESPGHQSIKITSENNTAYCTGDLFHHALEIENLDWVPTWAERRVCMNSKKNLIDAALREKALVIPSHLSAGRIVKDANTKSKVRFDVT